MPLNQELAKYYPKLLKLAEKITKGNKVDAQDLVQDLYVIILEYDQEKIKKIVENGHLVFWSARVLMNQYVRTNSAFKTKYYTKLRTENYDVKNFKYFDGIEELVEFENKLQFVKDKMNNLHEYDKLLFEIYFSSGKSIRKLAKDTGISTTSIYTTLKNVKQYLKDEVESEYKEFER
jgi:RNA polymerase sigma factor (sigma-70 family)